MDVYVFKKAPKLGRHRHRNKGAKWLNSKYWITQGDNWYSKQERGNLFGYISIKLRKRLCKS